MKIWWLAIRPKTLLASIGPVLLATALASKQVEINYAIFVATLCCALMLQISVNLANDLFDGLSGVDNEHRVGPIRALHSGVASVTQLKMALIISTGAAVTFGCYLIFQGGLPFLALGLLSILGVYSYSAGPFPLASHALGEVAVFIFFGLIAVIGSFYLQIASLNASIIGYACVVGLLNAALMLVNNIRDIHSDRHAGKFTLAVKLGDTKSRALYKWLILLAFSIHVLASLPNLVVQLAPLFFCLLLLPNLLKGINQFTGSKLNEQLANTAKFGFLYCISTSVVLLIF